MTGRRCAGSCLCCTPGSRGGTCRSSSGSGRGRPVGGGWTSGRRRGYGRSCTSSCWRSCTLPVRSSGRGRCGRDPCSGEKGGSKTGPSPVDRARNGSKHHLMVDGTASRLRDPHGRKPQRRHPADPTDRGPARARPGRPSAQAARPSTPIEATTTTSTAPAPSARHQPRDRPPQDRARLRARQLPLGRRTDLRLAPPLPTAPRPLRRRAEMHEAFLSLACAIICWRRLRNLSLC